MAKAWICLFIAGIFEIIWAVGLKYTDGFTKFIPSTITIVFSLASFYLLAFSMREIPMGTSYAVWVGIGTIGTIIAGIILFDEPLTIVRVFFAFLIMIGIAGLKIATN